MTSEAERIFEQSERFRLAGLTLERVLSKIADDCESTPRTKEAMDARLHAVTVDARLALEHPKSEATVISAYGMAERVALLQAHRPCHAAEHNSNAGRIHGWCLVCGVPWPCEYAGTPPDKPLTLSALTRVTEADFDAVWNRAKEAEADRDRAQADFAVTRAELEKARAQVLAMWEAQFPGKAFPGYHDSLSAITHERTRYRMGAGPL